MMYTNKTNKNKTHCKKLKKRVKNQNNKKVKRPVLGSGCICTGVVWEGTGLNAGEVSRDPPSCDNSPGNVEGLVNTVG